MNLILVSFGLFHALVLVVGTVMALVFGVFTVLLINKALAQRGRASKDRFSYRRAIIGAVLFAVVGAVLVVATVALGIMV